MREIDHLPYATNEYDDARLETEQRWLATEAEDDRLRAAMALEGIPSETIDYVLHGETITGFGARISRLPEAEPYLGPLDENGRCIVNPEAYAKAIAEQEREIYNGDGATTEELMRPSITIDRRGGGRSGRARRDDSRIFKDTTDELHEKLKGRPRKGDEPRVTVGPRVDPKTKVTFLNAGEQMGPWLDEIATYLDRRYTGAQIREALANAAKYGMIGVQSNTLVSPGETVADLPRAA